MTKLFFSGASVKGELGPLTEHFKKLCDIMYPKMKVMNLSKSGYCSFIQCPKRLWLSRYKSEEAAVAADAAKRLSEGSEVGKLARGLFGPFTDVTALRADGSPDCREMLQKTREALQRGDRNICEAAFSFDGCYCQADILHKTDGGYEIYEVKSSNGIKEINRHDVAFQKYVLEHCQIPVAGVYLVCLNKEYRRKGDLEAAFGKLFKCTPELSVNQAEIGAVAKNIARAKALLANVQEPPSKFCKFCVECEFFGYCRKGLPEPSVLDLANCPEKWEYAAGGIYTMSELLESGIKLDARVRQQIEHTCFKREAEIDKEKIKEFLSSLWYPICFLDFETTQSALPPFDGARTWQQIPFQYSVHTVEYEGAEPKHFEFLAETDGDPRRALAERLLKDIPKGACVVAYNMQFEKAVIKELAESFADLAPGLAAIRENVRDIMLPFSRRYYYNREMHGSYSLKSVAPALFPGENDGDYKNLEGVHNGTEAMDIFPRMKQMTEAERAEAKKQLLAYCGYDTLNTVKIWRELIRVSK